MKKTLMSLATISLLALSFTGCGGGGDGDSKSSSGTVTFPANAIVAEPTPENADKVAETVVKDPSSTINGLGINSVSSEKVASSIQLLKQSEDLLNTSLKKHPIDNNALNETVNESYNCSDGGSIQMNGSGSEAAGGTITYTYNQCKESSTVMNGKMRVVMSNYNSDADEYATTNIQFLTDFNVNANQSYNFSYKAGSYINQKVIAFSDSGYGYQYPSNIAIDTSYIITMNELKFGLKNCKFNFKYSNSYSNLEYIQTQGRIYIDNALTNYVDADTAYTPAIDFFYTNGSLDSGEGHYIMGNNTKLTLTATGDGAYSTTFE